MNRKPIITGTALLCALSLTACEFDGFRGFTKGSEAESVAEQSERPAESSEISDSDESSAADSQSGSARTDSGAVFTYDVEDNALYLVDVETKSGALLEELTLPESVNGMPVTGVAEYGFNGNAQFQSVRIPPTLQFMGDYAFGNCSSLKKAAFDQTEIKMGEYCFDDSTLQCLYAEGIISMDSYCFYGMPMLETVMLRGSITLDEYCFRNCPQLRDVWLTECYLTVGDYSFTNCGMQQVIIENCKGTIGEYCFMENPALETAVIGEGITELAGYCFIECPKLKTVVLPASLTKISESCFYDAAGLTIIAPEGSYALEFAAEHGFSAVALEVSNILDTLPEMPEWDAPLTESTAIDPDADTETEYVDSYGDSTDIPDGSYNKAIRLKDIMLRGDIRIGKNCFCDCPMLENILIGDGSLEIGDGSFQNSSAETVLIMAESGKIGNDCFCGLYRAYSVCIEEGLTSIGSGCFKDCTSLETVELPESVTEIGEGCFEGCTSRFMILAPEGSYALQYANEHGINCHGTK